MGIDEHFDREMSILDEEFAGGRITRQEYDEAVRELERDMSLDVSDYGPEGMFD